MGDRVALNQQAAGGVSAYAQGREGAALIREGRQGRLSKAFEQPTGSVKLRRVEVTPSVLRPLDPCILWRVETEAPGGQRAPHTPTSRPEGPGDV